MSDVALELLNFIVEYFQEIVVLFFEEIKRKSYLHTYTLIQVNKNILLNHMVLIQHC